MTRSLACQSNIEHGALKVVLYGLNFFVFFGLNLKLTGSLNSLQQKIQIALAYVGWIPR